MRGLMARITDDGTIEVKEFLDLYRDCFRPENNFLLEIKLEDWVWLKTHITDGTYFGRDQDAQRNEKILPVLQKTHKP